MFGAAAETEHAQEMADAMARHRAEVGDDEATVRLEHAEHFRQAATLEVGGEVVEHQTREDRIEVIDGRGD